jgi:formate hydrogenlyase subunit 3/multisubunit Na+/H+ antiporter MnhD subunit
MNVTWLALVPFGVAIAAFVLQKLRPVAILLTAVALGMMIFLVVRYSQGFSLLVLGRSLGLSALEIAGLGFCFFLALIIVLYSFYVPEGDLSYTLVLLAIMVLSIATAMRNLTIGGLLLQIGLILTAMLIPSTQPKSAMAGMRTLVLLVLSGPFLLLASWALEGQVADPSNVQFANLGSITMAIGFGLLLPVMPFHIWAPPIYKYSTPLAIVTCTVILNIVIMLRVNNLLFATPWAAGKEHFTALLLAGGLITAILGGLLAMPQRSLHRALAFAAISEAGLALASLAVGTELGVRAALLHTLYRGLAVTVMAMVLGTFRRTLGGDDPEHLAGALRRTPLAVGGLVVAGLSLVGLPPTAGFTTRFMIYRVLGQRDPAWAMAALAASMGPALAFIRCMVSALTPVPAERARWIEPLLTGVLILALSIPLLVLGIRPELMVLPPGP